MKLRSSSSLLVAVLVVLGFVLGSVSTATAGPALTKKVVKKIAAKVVKKAAPTLSVAHADSATNASNLNGLPADAYLDRIAFAGGGTSVAVTAGVDTQFATLNLTVPATAPFVRITGSLTFETPGAPSLATIWASVDKTCPDPTGIGFDDVEDLDRSAIRTRYLGLGPDDRPGGAHVIRARAAH